jgi:hypothetical protein
MGQNLVDLCIASKLRMLNGRVIGDMLGIFTFHKLHGAITVDYCLTDVDLINIIIFFQVSDQVIYLIFRLNFFEFHGSTRFLR